MWMSKLGGGLGCSYHEVVAFRILRGGSRTKSRTLAVDFRRIDFHLLRDLCGRIPQDTVLERRGIQESWLILKDQAQKWSILTSRK